MIIPTGLFLSNIKTEPISFTKGRMFSTEESLFIVGKGFPIDSLTFKFDNSSELIPEESLSKIVFSPITPTIASLFLRAIEKWNICA